MKRHRKALMLDIGGVLKARNSTPLGGGLWQTKEYLQTPPAPKCTDFLPSICEKFAGQIIVVSRCSDKVEREKKINWYKFHQFHKITGIPACKILFCHRREEKATICAENGVQIAVDNKPEVFAHMLNHVPHRFLYAPKPEDLVPAGANILSQVTIFYDWKELHEAIMSIPLT